MVRGTVKAARRPAALTGRRARKPVVVMGRPAMKARTVSARHWRSYGDHPLLFGEEALDEPLRAFPSWFLRVVCDRCGKERMVNEAHMAQGEMRNSGTSSTVCGMTAAAARDWHRHERIGFSEMGGCHDPICSSAGCNAGRARLVPADWPCRKRGGEPAESRADHHPPAQPIAMEVEPCLR